MWHSTRLKETPPHIYIPSIEQLSNKCNYSKGATYSDDSKFSNLKAAISIGSKY